jgi:hypothetical protein
MSRYTVDNPNRESIHSNTPGKQQINNYPCKTKFLQMYDERKYFFEKTC